MSAAICPENSITGEDLTLYGLLAEFAEAEALVEAARRTRAAGYRCFDAYSPFPIKGLISAMDAAEDRITWTVFWGGVVGGVGAFVLLTYLVVFNYPLNIGGRPLFDWPAFVPITFEMTVLTAALTGLAGLLVLNGLPMPYHPVLDQPGFERATSDRFFLCIESRDPRFDSQSTRAFLEQLSPVSVAEVEQRR